jgi:hypothetical protein
MTASTRQVNKFVPVTPASEPGSNARFERVNHQEKGTSRFQLALE